jgi:hypothetical protein
MVEAVPPMLTFDVDPSAAQIGVKADAPAPHWSHVPYPPYTT